MPYILVVQNFEEITDQLVTKVLCDMAVLQSAICTHSCLDLDRNPRSLTLGTWNSNYDRLDVTG